MYDIHNLYILHRKIFILDIYQVSENLKLYIYNITECVCNINICIIYKMFLYN